MRESRNEYVQVSCFWKAKKFGQNFHQLLMLLRIKSRLGYFLSQCDSRAGTGILHVPPFPFADLQLGSKSVANIHTHILLFLSFLIKPYLTALSLLFYAFLKVLLPLAPLLNSLFSANWNFWYTFVHSTEFPQWPFIFLTTITGHKKVNKKQRAVEKLAFLM